MNTHKDIYIPNRSGEICIYCQGKATDKDHVVCRNLFPDKGRGSSLLTVPACHDCNVGLSGDEEFFRLFIAGLSLDWSDKAKIVFDTHIKRQISRRPNLGLEQFKKMTLVDLKTPAGIFTGQKATLQHITEDDWKRCHRVVEKTVRGLIYTLHGDLLGETYEMQTALGWNETIKTFLPWLEYFEPSDYKGVFAFGFALAADAPPISVWFTQYYDRFTFCTWINERGSFPEINSSEKKRILDLRT